MPPTRCSFSPRICASSRKMAVSVNAHARPRVRGASFLPKGAPHSLRRTGSRCRRRSRSRSTSTSPNSPATGPNNEVTMTISTTLDTPFDVASEEGTPPRELIPPGKYKAEISTATVGPTKNARGQAVNLTWTFTEGVYEKRCVFQSILIQHDSEDAQRFGRQRFKDVCSACGITESVTNLDVLLYKPCLITVTVRKDKNGEFPDKNEVARVAPVVSWNRPKPASATAPAAGLLKEASATPKAFEAKRDPMNDEIPF